MRAVGIMIVGMGAEAEAGKVIATQAVATRAATAVVDSTVARHSAAVRSTAEAAMVAGSTADADKRDEMPRVSTGRQR